MVKKVCNFDTEDCDSCLNDCTTGRSDLGRVGAIFGAGKLEVFLLHDEDLLTVRQNVFKPFTQLSSRVCAVPFQMFFFLPSSNLLLTLIQKRHK